MHKKHVKHQVETRFAQYYTSISSMSSVFLKPQVKPYIIIVGCKQLQIKCLPHILKHNQ